MLEGGTPFAQATRATVMAIRALQADIDAPQPVRAAPPAPATARPARPAPPAVASTVARHEPATAGAADDDWQSF
jgi:hypothetical protein